jgi:hypothetical protein
MGVWVGGKEGKGMEEEREGPRKAEAGGTLTLWVTCPGKKDLVILNQKPEDLARDLLVLIFRQMLPLWESDEQVCGTFTC